MNQDINHEKNINSIRLLAADMVEKAKSGHPGMPMGAAPMAYVLWTKFLRHNPKNPEWLNRDRFVLSAGHGSALLYSLLHLTGYKVGLDDLKQFRQWDSITPGHPEYGVTPGVETTTGPLGQGFATGVGMAIAERFMANHFNKENYPIIDYNIYSIVSDGDLMEGLSAEAASLAGNLKLNRLIYLYDSNDISIEGSTELAFCEDVASRFMAYRWHVIEVKDGNNIEEIEKAIEAAKADERPSLIVAHTHIGYGSSKQDSPSAHGEPLGEEALAQVKKKFGWPEEKSFYIPDEALNYFRKAINSGSELEKKWNDMYKKYKFEFGNQAEELETLIDGKLPTGWDTNLKQYSPNEGPLATRGVSGEVLNVLAENLHTILGGSADLAPSNKTYLKGRGDITCHNPTFAARNLHFGVRENAMASILNGMALSRAVIPFGGTFFTFTDYMRPGMRLAALMKIRVIHVLTHDSIAVGEDGPTHEPIEHLAGLRAMPGYTVIRPADANETREAWKFAVRHKGPTGLVLTRQKLPVIDQEKYAQAENLTKGAYALNEGVNEPDIILIATGSEVSLIMEAGTILKKDGIKARLVSMPSWELFEASDKKYRDNVLLPSVTARLAVEAGATQGWHKYVGSKGKVIGIDRFGASAPGDIVMEKFGFTVENVVKQAKEILNK